MKKISENVSQPSLSFWIKVSVFIALFMGSAFYFGVVIERIGTSFDITPPYGDSLLSLFISFLLALSAMIISAGLVAGLLRPLWIAALASGLSGVGMLLGWEISVFSVLSALGFALITLLYIFTTQKELDGHLRFTSKLVNKKNMLLLMTLVVILCGNLYVQYTEFVRDRKISEDDLRTLTQTIQEGFQKQFIDLFAPKSSESEKKQMMEKLEKQFELQKNIRIGLDQIVEISKEYLPAVLAFIVFATLIQIVLLFRLFFYLIFPSFFFLLKITKVVREKTQVVEAKRLVL